MSAPNDKNSLPEPKVCHTGSSLTPSAVDTGEVDGSEVRENFASVAPSSKSPSAASQTGSNRYHHRRPLATGGHGVVTVAYDTELGREVALKQLRPEYDLESMRQRLRSEAEIIGKLEHPGIAPVYGLVIDATGGPQFAMRLYEKRTLENEIFEYHANRSERELRKLVQRFGVVCNSIGYAHSRGILHRDIKPANIIVGDYNQTVVVDWGLAKKFAGVLEPETSGAGWLTPSDASDSLETEEGSSSVGTPEYRSPEQERGDWGNLGPRSDVYSLGASLYHLLTSKPPFRRASTNPDGSMRRVGLSKPRQVLASVDPALEAICLRALADDPRDRYAKATDLAEDLDRWLADEPVSCYREPWTRRSARWRRKHPVLSFISIVAPLFLMVATTLTFWAWSRYQENQRVQLMVESLLTDADSFFDTGELPKATEKLNEARIVLRGSDKPQFRDRLERAVERVGTEVQRKKTESKRIAAGERVEKFQRQAADAEYDILGTLRSLLPHEDPKGLRRIVEDSERSADLVRGTRTAEEALQLLGLPEDADAFQKLGDLGVEKKSLDAVRERSAEILFLLALGWERRHQGGPESALAKARERAVRLLDASEATGNGFQFLYRFRAKFHRALGHTKEADVDEQQAAKLPLKTFFDHVLRADELFLDKDPTGAIAAYQQALVLRPNEYWSMFRLAKTLEKSRQFDQAESLLRSCSTLHPTDPTLHNSRGTILHQLKRWDEAAAAFETCLQHRPDYFMAYGNLALVHAENKRPDRAEAVLTRFLAKYPNRALQEGEIRSNVGLAYERVGQADKAIAWYADGVRLAPDDVTGLVNYSIQLVKKSRLVEAEKHLRHAMELDPRSIPAYRAYAELRLVKGLPKEAIAEYTKALAIDPKDWVSLYNRGILWRRLGDYEASLKDSNTVLRIAPGHRDAHAEAGLTLAMAGDLLGAYSWFRYVLDGEDRPDPEVLRFRGKVLGDLAKVNFLAESEKDLTQAVKLEPKHPDNYRSRGNTRFRAEKWAEAIADYRHYLRLEPNADDRSNTLNNISTAYRELGEIDKALVELNQAIRLQKSPSLLFNRGNLWLDQGDLKRAIQDFSEAIRVGRNEPNAWALRGQTRLLQGEYTNAVLDLRECLRLKPGFYETLVLLSLAQLGAGDESAARTILQKVARERPDHLRGRFSRGVLLFLERNYLAAIPELTHADKDVALAPFAMSFRARAWLAVGTDCSAAAVADADRILTLPRAGGALLVEAASVLAKSSILTKDARKADRAVVALRRARTLGYFENPASLASFKADGLFLALRDHAGFKELLEALEP